MAASALARRRANFPKLKGWQRNRAGNWQIEIRRFRLTVFERSDGWAAVIAHPARPGGLFTRSPARSFAEAQLAAFDLFVLLEQQIGRE